MRNLLNRIEREYVLKIVSERLPALSLQIGHSVFIAPSASYGIEGDSVILGSSFPDGPVRVHFRHQLRMLHFDSAIVSNGSGVARVRIPDSIEKFGDDGRGRAECRLRIADCDPPFEVADTPLFPVTETFVDPERVFALGQTPAEWAARAGVSLAAGVLSFRLADYADRLATGDPLAAGPAFLYADSEYTAFSAPAAVVAKFHASDAFSLSFLFLARTVSCPAKITGKVSLNADLSLICADVSSAQLEDKRFLHERLFRTLYQ